MPKYEIFSQSQNAWIDLCKCSTFSSDIEYKFKNNKTQIYTTNNGWVTIECSKELDVDSTCVEANEAGEEDTGNQVVGVKQSGFLYNKDTTDEYVDNDNVFDVVYEVIDITNDVVLSRFRYNYGDNMNSPSQNEGLDQNSQYIIVNGVSGKGGSLFFNKRQYAMDNNLTNSNRISVEHRFYGVNTNTDELTTVETCPSIDVLVPMAFNNSYSYGQVKFIGDSTQGNRQNSRIGNNARYDRNKEAILINNPAVLRVEPYTLSELTKDNFEFYQQNDANELKDNTVNNKSGVSDINKNLFRFELNSNGGMTTDYQASTFVNENSFDKNSPSYYGQSFIDNNNEIIIAESTKLPVQMDTEPTQFKKIDENFFFQKNRNYADTYNGVNSDISDDGITFITLHDDPSESNEDRTNAIISVKRVNESGSDLPKAELNYRTQYMDKNPSSPNYNAPQSSLAFEARGSVAISPSGNVIAHFMHFSMETRPQVGAAQIAVLNVYRYNGTDWLLDSFNTTDLNGTPYQGFKKSTAFIAKSGATFQESGETYNNETVPLNVEFSTENDIYVSYQDVNYGSSETPNTVLINSVSYDGTRWNKNSAFDTQISTGSNNGFNIVLDVKVNRNNSRIVLNEHGSTPSPGPGKVRLYNITGPNNTITVDRVYDIVNRNNDILINRSDGFPKLKNGFNRICLDNTVGLTDDGNTIVVSLTKGFYVINPITDNSENDFTFVESPNIDDDFTLDISGDGKRIGVISITNGSKILVYNNNNGVYEESFSVESPLDAFLGTALRFDSDSNRFTVAGFDTYSLYELLIPVPTTADLNDVSLVIDPDGSIFSFNLQKIIFADEGTYGDISTIDASNVVTLKILDVTGNASITINNTTDSNSITFDDGSQEGGIFGDGREAESNIDLLNDPNSQLEIGFSVSQQDIEFSDTSREFQLQLFASENSGFIQEIFDYENPYLLFEYTLDESDNFIYKYYIKILVLGF